MRTLTPHIIGRNGRPIHWMTALLAAGFLTVAGSTLFAQAPEGPEALRAAAEQHIAQADSARDAGREGTALQVYEEARDAYMELSEQFPEWSVAEVQSRLFYCRQELSALEMAMESDDDDELGFILNMIEQQGIEPAKTEPVQPAVETVEGTQVIQPMLVQETEIVEDFADLNRSVPSSEAYYPAPGSEKRFRKEGGAGASVGATREVQKQVTELQRRNEKLEEETKQAQRELEKTALSLKETQQREEQLKADLKRARSAGGTDWDAPVPLGGSMGALQAGPDLSSDVKELERTVKQLEREKADMVGTVADLQKRLKNAGQPARGVSAADAVGSKRSDLEAENRKLTVELGRTKDQVEALRRQLSSRKEEERVYSEVIENTDARWSQDNLKLKQELNRERSTSMELQEAVKSLRASLNQAERERMDLLKEQRERIPAVEDAKSRYEAKNTELQGRLNQTMQELAGVKRRMLEQADALSRQTTQNKTLAERLDLLQEDYLKLANSSAVTAAENVDHKGEAEQLMREMEGLRRDMEGVQDEVQEKDRYAEQLKAAGRQLDAMQADLADRDFAYKKAVADLETSRREIEGLRKIKTSLEISQLEKVEWNQQKEQLQARLDDALVEKMDVEVALAKMASEKNNAEKLTEKVKSDYAEVIRKNEDLQKKMAARSGERSQETDKLNDRVAQLQRQTEQKDKRIQEMASHESEVASLRSELGVLELKHRDDVKETQLALITEKKKNESLASQMQDMQSRLAAVGAEADGYRGTTQNLEKEKQELERRLDGEGRRQHEELLSMKKELAQEKVNSATWQDEIRRLQAQMKELSDTKLSYEKKLIESEKEKDDLEREVIESDEAWRVKLAAAMKDAEVSAERQENVAKTTQQFQAALQAAEHKTEEWVVQVAEKEKRISDLKQANKELESKITQAVQAATSFTDKTEAELSRLQKQNADLRARTQEMDRLQAAAEKKEETIHNYEAELKTANEQLARLSEAKKQWSASNEETQGQLSIIQDKVAALTRQLNDAQAGKETLEKDLLAARNDLSTMQADRKQGAARDAELEKTRNELVGVQKELAQVRKESEKTGERAEQLESVERELKEARKLLANVQKSNELNVKLVERMKKDMETSGTVGAQLAELSKERDQLMEQVRDWQSKCEKISADQAEQRNDTEQRNAQIAKQTQLITELNTSLKEKEQAITEMSNANKAQELEQARLTQEIKKLSLEQAAAELRAQEVQAKWKELNAEKKGFSKQAEALDDQLAKATKDRERLAAELEVSRNKAEMVDELKRNVKKLEADLSAGISERNALDGRIVEIGKALEAQQKASEESADQLQEMKKTLADQTDEVNKLRSERDVLSARVEALTSELNKATETLESLANY